MFSASMLISISVAALITSMGYVTFRICRQNPVLTKEFGWDLAFICAMFLVIIGAFQLAELNGSLEKLSAGKASIANGSNFYGRAKMRTLED